MTAILLWTFFHPTGTAEPCPPHSHALSETVIFSCSLSKCYSIQTFIQPYQQQFLLPSPQPRLCGGLLHTEKRPSVLKASCLPTLLLKNHTVTGTLSSCLTWLLPQHLIVHKEALNYTFSSHREVGLFVFFFYSSQHSWYTSYMTAIWITPPCLEANKQHLLLRNPKGSPVLVFLESSVATVNSSLTGHPSCLVTLLLP